MTQHPRLTRPEPLGMGEPPRPEIAAALARNEAQALDAVLARIPVHRLPRAMAEALARRTGAATARRIAELAATLAGEA
jgi:hypothetical protein